MLSNAVSPHSFSFYLLGVQKDATDLLNRFTENIREATPARVQENLHDKFRWIDFLKIDQQNVALNIWHRQYDVQSKYEALQRAQAILIVVDISVEISQTCEDLQEFIARARCSSGRRYPIECVLVILNPGEPWCGNMRKVNSYPSDLQKLIKRAAIPWYAASARSNDSVNDIFIDLSRALIAKRANRNAKVSYPGSAGAREGVHLFAAYQPPQLEGEAPRIAPASPPGVQPTFILARSPSSPQLSAAAAPASASSSPGWAAQRRGSVPGHVGSELKRCQQSGHEHYTDLTLLFESPCGHAVRCLECISNQAQIQFICPRCQAVSVVSQWKPCDPSMRAPGAAFSPLPSHSLAPAVARADFSSVQPTFVLARSPSSPQLSAAAAPASSSPGWAAQRRGSVPGHVGSELKRCQQSGHEHYTDLTLLFESPCGHTVLCLECISNQGPTNPIACYQCPQSIYMWNWKPCDSRTRAPGAAFSPLASPVNSLAALQRHIPPFSKPLSPAPSPPLSPSALTRAAKCACCNVYMADHVCVPCGHISLCERCTQDPQIKYCPVSSCAKEFIHKIKIYDDPIPAGSARRITCPICLGSHIADYIFVPCWHMLCNECISNAADAHTPIDKCPFCRAEVLQKTKILMPDS